MGNAKLAGERDTLATLHKDHGDGTLCEQREGPDQAGDGQAGEKKEATSSPLKQHDRPSREVTLRKVTPQADKPVHPLQGNPSPSPDAQSREGSGRPPSWHEHRHACRLKYG
jgi:hypothetical protein